MALINRMAGCAAALLLVTATAGAAVLDEARAVASTTRQQEGLPAPETFQVAAAGTFTLHITDLGELAAQPGPAPFSSLTVVISRGAQLISQLSVPANASTANASITLSPGTYQAQVLGVTPGVSLFGSELRNAANAIVWDAVGTIDSTPDPDYSSLQQPLNLVAGRNYVVTLNDRAFPAALGSLQANVIINGTAVCPIAGSGSCPAFTAASSSGLLVVLASNATPGLYSVKVTEVGGTQVYAATLPVGNVPKPRTIPLPGTGSYTLTTTDLQVPVALTSFRSVIIQGAELLGSQAAVGTRVFNGNAGDIQLYVYATPAPGLAGLYGVSITQGAAAISSYVESVGGTSGSAGGQVFDAVLATAGQYVVDLRDFVTPQQFASLSMGVTQNGQLLAQRSSSGPVTVDAVAGTLTIAVLPKAGTTGIGLYGVSVTKTGASAPVLEVTQGIGGMFRSSKVTFAQAGKYGLQARDFSAPAALTDLIITLTRGSQQLGTVFAAGGTSTFPFDAVSGDYVLSVLGKPQAGAQLGMYGVTIISAPTVTLQATPASVVSGSPTTLTWSSTDADTCTASGGWTGNQMTSGSLAVASVTVANNAYSLNCTGPGGQTPASVTVTVTNPPAGSNGGGGAIQTAMLLLLSVLLVPTVRRRR